jgi:hypothetical protein
MTAIDNYSEPVAQLLRRGGPGFDESWQECLDEGFGPEHIPELIRLANSVKFEDVPEETPELWAPVHAWRVLGQLRAIEAAAPLLGLLSRIDEFDDDWVSEEIPRVLALIGPETLPLLESYLREEHGPWAKSAASAAIAYIGKRYPESRPNCVSILAEQLERFAEHTPDLNASLVGGLMDLKAVETAQLIQRAFEANVVSTFMVGDWPYVEYELGLTDTPPRRKSYLPSFTMPGSLVGDELAWGMTPEQRAELAKRRNAERKKQKQKAKQAKAQRKQQRRRR